MKAFAEVEEVFRAAALVEPRGREAFLEGRCRGRADLRAEVDALLAEHDRCNGFLETPVMKIDAKGEPSPDAAGTTVGPYRLKGVIGRGSAGTVYLAEQESPVRRRVAIKILRAGLDGDEALARFDLERAALSLMDHPNVARVHDAGVTESGRPFVAMEYVPGLPLGDSCDRHRLSIDRRLALFVTVCGAVHHAHQKGIVHRDLKPGNILVVESGDGPTPKVIDFGIAKATASRAGGRGLTHVGEFIGTPEYMAPEQAGALVDDVDTRSDVFSLGVILYELLAGVLPFDGAALRAGGVLNVQTTLRDVDPPSMRARLRGLAPQALARAAASRAASPPALLRRLSGDLEWIVARAMAKDRSMRYASASELAADVRRHRANEPVTAGPRGSMYALAKFIRRRRAVVIAGGCAAVSLVAGLVASLVLMREASHHREAAEDALLRAKEAQASASRRLQGAYETIGKMIPQSEALASVLGSTGVRDQSAAMALEQLLDLARDAESPADVSTTRSHLGYAYERVGDVKMAMGQVDEALAAYRASVASREIQATAFPDDPEQQKNLGVGRWMLADAHAARGRLAEARVEALLALDLMRRATRAGGPAAMPPAYLGMAHRRVADAHAALGERGEAIAAYRHSLEVFTDDFMRDNPTPPNFRNRARAMLGLAEMLDPASPECADLLRSAMESAQRSASDNSPVDVRAQTLATAIGLTWARTRAGRGLWSQAIDRADKAVESAAVLAEGDPLNFESQRLHAVARSTLASARLGAAQIDAALDGARGASDSLRVLTMLRPDHARAAADLAHACLVHAHAVLATTDRSPQALHDAREACGRGLAAIAALERSRASPALYEDAAEGLRKALHECER